MSETKFVFCENCKRVFEMDAVSHINECPACDVPNPMPEIPESVADELARRDEIIKRLKEDTERLVIYPAYMNLDRDMICVHCGELAENEQDIQHDKDCPITLHRALMKELEC